MARRTQEPKATVSASADEKLAAMIETAISGATSYRGVSGIGTELGILENIRDGFANGVVSDEDTAFVELIVSRIDEYEQASAS